MGEGISSATTGEQHQPRQRRQKPAHAGHPASRGPHHPQRQADAEQGARPDVAVGLHHDLLQARQVGHEPFQERLLVVLDGLLPEDVGLLRILAAPAGQRFEAVGHARAAILIDEHERHEADQGGDGHERHRGDNQRSHRRWSLVLGLGRWSGAAPRVSPAGRRPVG
jgi:hypothetical protein